MKIETDYIKLDSSILDNGLIVRFIVVNRTMNRTNIEYCIYHKFIKIKPLFIQLKEAFPDSCLILNNPNESFNIRNYIILHKTEHELRVSSSCRYNLAMRYALSVLNDIKKSYYEN